MNVSETADGRAMRRTALVSVAAAAFLVAVKLATGLATGSLAFVAEAVHSGTDLVAALLTLFAVRVAVRPPDEEHHYGHGKAEHLAALAESAFLLLVSLAIAFESARRLADGGGHEVEATWWAIAVIVLVIAVDASRTVVSRRAARRYHSPAFGANALHFASDLAGSTAVLVGHGARGGGRAVGRLGRGPLRRRARGARRAAAGPPVGGRADGPRRRRRRRPHPRKRSPRSTSRSSCAGCACATPRGGTSWTWSWGWPRTRA